jgi:hypothetical protein
MNHRSEPRDELHDPVASARTPAVSKQGRRPGFRSSVPADPPSSRLLLSDGPSYHRLRLARAPGEPSLINGLRIPAPAITDRSCWTTVDYEFDHTCIREKLKSCSQSAPTHKRRLSCGSFHQPRSKGSRRLHIRRLVNRIRCAVLCGRADGDRRSVHPSRMIVSEDTRISLLSWADWRRADLTTPPASRSSYP